LIKEQAVVQLAPPSEMTRPGAPSLIVGPLPICAAVVVVVVVVVTAVVAVVYIESVHRSPRSQSTAASMNPTGASRQNHVPLCP
jgi:hypothetical protein